MLKVFLYFLFASISLSTWSTPLSTGSLSGYLTTTEISAFVTKLNSNLISQSTVGTTINSNAITCYTLSDATGITYIGLSSRPSIIITAGLTTSQPLSVTMALYILGSIVSANSSDPNYNLYQFLLQSTTIYIIPIINIDAYKNMSDSNKLIPYLKNFHAECP